MTYVILFVIVCLSFLFYFDYQRKIACVEFAQSIGAAYGERRAYFGCVAVMPDGTIRVPH